MFELFWVGMIFGVGLSAGSFVNALVFRLEHGRSLLGRSQCPQCGQQLSWTDLIPFISFLLLRGKCRSCKSTISLQYPIVEFATGLLFLLLYIHVISLSFPQIVVLFGIVTLLAAIFLYDLKHMLIPDVLLYPAIGLALLWRFFESWPLSHGEWAHLAASALGAAFFFFLIYALSKGRAMGFGDVKLAFFMGLFLSWPSLLVALFFAFFSGAFVGITLVGRKKKALRSEIPFGPFLIAGTFFALLWGKDIFDWYQSMLLV
ncbi:MAG: prepilin peptidase [Candidatus Yanofskybacteria bacterium]|nr:prepilin peptidase [Candidatus Yanofskybacteria bacterium]